MPRDLTGPVQGGVGYITSINGVLCIATSRVCAGVLGPGVVRSAGTEATQGVPALGSTAAGAVSRGPFRQALRTDAGRSDTGRYRADRGRATSAGRLALRLSWRLTVNGVGALMEFLGGGTDAFSQVCGAGAAVPGRILGKVNLTESLPQANPTTTGGFSFGRQGGLVALIREVQRMRPLRHGQCLNHPCASAWRTRPTSGFSVSARIRPSESFSISSATRTEQEPPASSSLT